MKPKFKPRSLFLAVFGPSILLTALLYAQVGQTRSVSTDKVILIGLDAMRNVTTTSLSFDDYRRDLTRTLGSVNDSIIPVLKRSSSLKTQNKTSWHINSVSVGVGIAGTAGLGPLVNVTPSAQIRLVFTNQLTPIYPN